MEVEVKLTRASAPGLTPSRRRLTGWPDMGSAGCLQTPAHKTTTMAMLSASSLEAWSAGLPSGGGGPSYE